MVNKAVALSILNKSVVDVIDSVTRITPLEFEEKEEAIRLDEAVINVAESMKITRPAVVAHKLDQYYNKFYTLHVDEVMPAPIDILINSEDSIGSMVEIGETE